MLCLIILLVWSLCLQDARGDQCDKCGRLINATELKVCIANSLSPPPPLSLFLSLPSLLSLPFSLPSLLFKCVLIFSLSLRRLHDARCVLMSQKSKHLTIYFWIYPRFCTVCNIEHARGLDMHCTCTCTTIIYSLDIVFFISLCPCSWLQGFKPGSNVLRVQVTLSVYVCVLACVDLTMQ